MKWVWWTLATVAIASGVGMAVSQVAAQRFERIERRLDETQKRLDRVIRENLLRNGGHAPWNKGEKDLAAWREEIDRLVQESYGELLRITLTESQVRKIVDDLQKKVTEGIRPDLADPATKQQLKEVVDRVVSEHLYERGMVLKKKTPTLEEVAQKIGLDPLQREPFAQVFQETRGRVMGLLKSPRQDGRDLLAEFYQLENLPWASPEREQLGWKLLKTPVTPDGKNLHQWMIDLEADIQKRLDGVLTPDQTARYRWFNFVPWDLVGISLQTERGPEPIPR